MALGLDLIDSRLLDNIVDSPSLQPQAIGKIPNHTHTLQHGYKMICMIHTHMITSLAPCPTFIDAYQVALSSNLERQPLGF